MTARHHAKPFYWPQSTRCKLNTKFYIPATSPLKNVIRSIWQIEGLTFFQKEQIIPKGIAEIIFNFSDSAPVLIQSDGSQYHLSRCFINGFNTKPLQLHLPKYQVYFGVQFQPLAVKKVFGAPACEFSDVTVDLTLIHSDFQSLWHRLAEENDFHERVSVFLDWIKRNSADVPPQERLVNHFLYAVDQRDVSVSELASSLCYSSRQLSRKMVEATGMNTEEFLLHKKYLHAVDLIHHSQLSLTEIAYRSHFTDQSHFIKTFKAFTNMTPGAYRKNKSLVKGHLYQNVR